VSPETRAALHSCCHVMRLLADAVAVAIEECEKDSHADEISSVTHADPLDPIEEVSLYEGILHSAVADVGTDPAQISRTYVPDLNDRTYTQSGDMGESEGEKNPAPLTAEFCLTNDPKPRLKFFNAALFAQFWAAYPWKVGKKDAIAAFTVIDPNTGLVARFLEAIERQRQSDQWCRGFIPKPATWLRGERWADEVEATPPPGSSAAKRIAIVKRAMGPRADGGSWRDRCTHDPECDTPTGCELRRQREGIA